MSRKHVTNDTDKPIYVGGQLIPAGATRLVEVHEPLEAAPEQKPRPAEEIWAELLADKVADIAARLPEFADEALDGMLAIERAKPSPRKTLVEAIEFEKLQRIDAAEQEAKAKAEAEAKAAAEAEATAAGGNPPPADPVTT